LGSGRFWEVLGCSGMFWDARCSGETIYTAVAAHHTIETWFSWHFMAFHGMAPGTAGR